MIYKVTQEDIRDTNDTVDAIAEFAVCTSRELKYVFLTYDFDTPFRQLSFEDRRLKAAISAGYRMEKTRDYPDKTTRKLLNTGYPKVEEAIKAFKGIRRDVDLETLDSYNTQLEQFIEYSKQPKESHKDWEVAMKINKGIFELLKLRKEIIETLDLRADFKEELVGKVESAEAPKEISALSLRNERKLRQIEGK